MVSDDELEWQARWREETHQAALVEAMRNSRQEAEYKVKCKKFVEEAKRLRKIYPNDQEFGSVIADLLITEEL